jgi:hypothetical protein
MIFYEVFLSFLMSDARRVRSLFQRIAPALGGVALSLVGLFGSAHFAHAAALTSTNVEPASLVAGSTNVVTISFTTTTTIPADGRVLVTFPSGYNVSSASGATCSTMDGTFTTSVGGQTVTITRQNDGTGQTAAAETCTVSGIINPSAAGSTGVYALTTTDSVPTPLDTDVAVTADTITAAALTSTNVQPATLRTGSSNTVTVSFTIVNALESDGKVKVNFPSGFNVTAASNGTCSTMDGSFATNVSSQMVTITRSGGSSEPAGAQTCTISGVVNPTAVGAAGTYAITTTTSANAVHDSDAAVSSDNFTNSSSRSETVALTYSIDVSSPEEGDVYAPGDSVNVAWTSGGTGSMSYVNISYSEDGGSTWVSIDTNQHNNQEYLWTIPAVSSDEVVVKVEGTDLATVLATGESATFSIASGSSEDDADEGEDGDAAEEEVTEEDSGEEEDVDLVDAGTFVRGEANSTVYYADADGVLHPFLNEQTYFTYADSFDDVVTLDSDAFANYSVGTAMLPNMGMVLVKVESVNKVYAYVEEDGAATLRWITSEDLAIELYGADWNDYVIDVPVTSWGAFEVGEDIDSTSDLSVDLDSMMKREDLHD